MPFARGAWDRRPALNRLAARLSIVSLPESDTNRGQLSASTLPDIRPLLIPYTTEPVMAIDRALIYGYVFGRGDRAEAVKSRGVQEWQPGNGWLWVHLDRTSDQSEKWLRSSTHLDPLAIEALLAEEPRPRCVAIGDGLLVILRGVNLNVGADPEDMVSIRMWIDPNKVISLRARRLMAASDLREAIDRGEAPATPGAMLVEIAGLLIDRMGPVLDALNDAVDEVEESVLDSPSQELRSKLSRLRRQAITLRRFLAPQREVIARLQTDKTPLLSDVDRSVLREVADRLTRYIEELDSARDRAAVTQEELGGRISDQMNRNMYLLSIVAGIFLPLGLLTGLLGMNVGGIPGVNSESGFIVVCIVLGVLAAAMLWLFRFMKIM